jgi:hypothetical protein
MHHVSLIRGIIARVVALGALCVLTAPAAADEPPLIPRKALFSDADKSQVQLSPDGQSLAYLARSNDVMTLWLAPARAPEKAAPVAPQKTGPIFTYRWTYQPATIVYAAPAAAGTHVFLLDRT